MKMKKNIEKQMETYLGDHQPLFWDIADLDPPLPVMDPVGDYITREPENYYGCDFSGDQNVFQLFFTGASNYFPAIHKKGGERLDEAPVYLFDLQAWDGSRVENLHLNFKGYILRLLDYMKACEPDHEGLQDAYKELKPFSDRLARDEDYHLKSIDE